MGNKEKWTETLKGKSHYEAWKLIWGNQRITGEQKKALFKLWDQLQKEQKASFLEKAENPDWWVA